MKVNSIYILIMMVFISCNSSIQSEKELDQYINNEENGLIKTREVNPIVIKAMHLPPQYLAFKEIKYDGIPPSKYDSLFQYYNKSITIQLFIKPDEKHAGQDIMAMGIGSIEEFKSRAMEMNFNMEDYVSLSIDNKEYKPVLSNMENVYELNPGRNILLVFSPREKNSEFVSINEFVLTFNDVLFNTGINHFKFNKQACRGIPAIKIEKF